MKKIISFLLAVVLLVSAVPMAYAAETQDYSLGTSVVYTADDEANENWTVTVPAQLAPGGSGTVTLEGYWPSTKTITVTAQESVKLTNSINANDTKTLAVDFRNGISAAGSNTEKQTFTETVSVEAITNALFGTWDGHFYYTVGTANVPVLEGDGQTFYTMAPTSLSFRSTAPIDEFQEVQINGVTVDPSNYTLTEGSTIVTLSIDYLKTLNEAAHRITVVSDSGSPSAGFSVVEPEFSEQGLYYNMAYSYNENGMTMALVFHEDGTAELSSYYKEILGNDEGTYAINGNSITVSVGGDEIPLIASSDGLELAMDETTSFKADSGRVANTNESIYFYDDLLGGYVARAIDNTNRSSYSFITGINSKPTVCIAAAAFWGCDNLTGIDIPDSVTTISDSAFRGCSNLASITIPNNVNNIGAYAFDYCTSLSTITFAGTTAEWNAITFGDGWNNEVPATEVICSDGTVALS